MLTARQARRQEVAAQNARMEAARLEAQKIVATGKCPCCGRGLKRNWSMAGWWQCVQFGAVGFRQDASQPSCTFQTFTE